MSLVPSSRRGATLIFGEGRITCQPSGMSHTELLGVVQAVPGVRGHVEADAAASVVTVWLSGLRWQDLIASWLRACGIVVVD